MLNQTLSASVNHSLRRGCLQWIWLSVFVIAIDQISKYWVSKTLMLYQSIVVTPFFNLVLMHNKGAAYNFLAHTGNFALWLFGLIALIVSTVIVITLKRLPSHRRWLACALALVLGGALGNLIDRIVHGYVIDFLHFYLNNWHFATFNIADSAISVGAAMIFLQIVFDKRKG